MRNYLVRFVVAVSLALVATSRAFAAIPPAPENIRPSWLWSPVPSGHEVMLTWDAAPGATSYNVYIWDDAVSTWTAAATGLAELRYRNAGPPPMPAQYLVTAVNADGESAPSAVATVYEGEFNNYITVPWP